MFNPALSGRRICLSCGFLVDRDHVLEIIPFCSFNPSRTCFVVVVQKRKQKKCWPKLYTKGSTFYLVQLWCRNFLLGKIINSIISNYLFIYNTSFFDPKFRLSLFEKCICNKSWQKHHEGNHAVSFLTTAKCRHAKCNVWTCLYLPPLTSSRI